MTTYRRPGLLEICLASCLSQTYKEIEIIVGDDSPNDETQQMMNAKYADFQNITYLRNSPAKGEAGNIDDLFRRARGDFIMLMNDDDFLEVDAVANLLAVCDAHPDTDVVFGDQYLVDHSGKVSLSGSRRLNADYFRRAKAKGFQEVPGEAGLTQMFPNNGWLARARLVRQIGYKEKHGIGCEFVFGVELCFTARKIYYLNRYVSYYRRTIGSMSDTTRLSMESAHMAAYGYLKNLRVPAYAVPARRIARNRLAPRVVPTLARNGLPACAIKVLINHLDAYNYGLNPRFAYHLVLIAKAALSAATGSAVAPRTGRSVF